MPPDLCPCRGTKTKSHYLLDTSNPKGEAKIPLTPGHSPEATNSPGQGSQERRRRDERKAEKNPSLPPQAFLRSHLLGVGGDRRCDLVGFTGGRERGAPERCSAAMALPVPFVRLTLLLLVALPFCAAHPGPGFHTHREFQRPALDSGSCPSPSRVACFYFHLVRCRQKDLLVLFDSVRFCVDFVTAHSMPLVFNNS